MWEALIAAIPGVLNSTFDFIRDAAGIDTVGLRMQQDVLNAQQNMLQMQINGTLALDQHKTERQKQMFDFWTENMTYCVAGVAIVTAGAVAISD